MVVKSNIFTVDMLILKNNNMVFLCVADVMLFAFLVEVGSRRVDLSNRRWLSEPPPTTINKTRMRTLLRIVKLFLIYSIIVQNIDTNNSFSV